MWYFECWTLGAMTFSRITLKKMIMGIIVMPQYIVRRNVRSVWYSLRVILQSVIQLSVIQLSVIQLRVILMYIIRLNVTNC
jgi:hypothetical protein